MVTEQTIAKAEVVGGGLLASVPFWFDTLHAISQTCAVIAGIGGAIIAVNGACKVVRSWCRTFRMWRRR